MTSGCCNVVIYNLELLQLFTQDTAKGTGEWHLASAFIGNMQTHRLRYTGVRGKDYKGDIALDDINIVGCDVSIQYYFVYGISGIMFR